MSLIRTCALPLLLVVAAQANGADPLRDPTRPPTATAPIAAIAPEGLPLRLEAILSTGDSRLAIVNGQVVRQGARLANAVITEISADSIRYTYAGHDHAATLATRKLAVRKTANTLHEDKP